MILFAACACEYFILCLNVTFTDEHELQYFMLFTVLLLHTLFVFEAMMIVLPLTLILVNLVNALLKFPW